MKHAILAVVLLCLFVENAGSQGVGDIIEYVVDQERPIHQPMYFHLYIRYRDGRREGTGLEVASKVHALGVTSHGGGGEYGSSGYNFVIRYAGSIENDELLNEPADIYVVSLAVRDWSAMKTNHVAVMYQGQKKTIFTSSRFHCVMSPEEWKSGEDRPTFLDWEEGDTEPDAEYLAELEYTVGGLRLNEAVMKGDRLSMNMPNLYLRDMLLIIGRYWDVKIENRVDESILDLRFNARVDDMYWEDGVNSVLKQHGLMLVKDQETGAFAVIRKDDSRN